MIQELARTGTLMLRISTLLGPADAVSPPALIGETRGQPNCKQRGRKLQPAAWAFRSLRRVFILAETAKKGI